MSPDPIAMYKAYRNRLLRNPDDEKALIGQFAVLSRSGDQKQDPAYYALAKRAYEIDPGNLDCVMNYANALGNIGEFKSAIAQYSKCVDSAWKFEALHHIGVTHKAMGQYEKAIACYDLALEVRHSAEVAKDRALAILASGRLMDGFKAYECRRELANLKYLNEGTRETQKKLPPNVVHWEGQPLDGKHVVIYHEEGAGDFIMVSRFIRRLREKGAAKIELTGPVPSLLDLVNAQCGTDGVQPLEDGTDEPFKCDYVLGSMSLPWRTGVEYGNFDGRPYFRADPSGAVPGRGASLKVGLAWRGNPAYGQDVHRSMAFAELATLFDIPGIAFYSLQVGDHWNEINRLGFDGFIADLAPLCRTWSDTARLVQSMDVVVTVDTGVGHLAGALGKPALIMVTYNTDWRWLRQTHQTPWYDSVKIFRQRVQDDWKPVLARVKGTLRGMLHERRSHLRQDSSRRACESAA